jgi:hypothetical protein
MNKKGGNIIESIIGNIWGTLEVPPHPTPKEEKKLGLFYFVLAHRIGCLEKYS